MKKVKEKKQLPNPSEQTENIMNIITHDYI